MGVVDTIDWVCVLCGRHIQNDWASSKSASNFALTLNIPPWKLWRWFRRLKLWATGDWQLHHDNAPAHALHLVQFFCETSNHPGDIAPLQPRFGVPWLLAFPETKTPLKSKRFQIINEMQEYTTGQLMVIGRNVWGPKVPTLKRTKASLFYVQCFLSLIFSSVNNFLYFQTILCFSYYMAGYLMIEEFLVVGRVW